MSGYNKKPRKSRGTVPGGNRPRVGSTGNTGSSRSGSTGSASSGSTGSNPFLSGVLDPHYKLYDLLTGTLSPYVQNLSNQNDNGKSHGFDDILARFAGNSDIAALLNSLGVNNLGSFSNSSAEDWNKQLVETLINYQLEQEKRNYNEGLRDEQRIYDSPTNQLARLMGAGVSRDAAIQMLSGSGSGSGGSGVPYSDGAALSEGIPASQSNLNDIQGKTAIANTVFGGISAISSLTSLGLSIPQAISQINMMRNASYLSDQQRTAFDAASGAFTILNKANIENAAEVFGSIANTIDTIKSLAAEGNHQAKAFISRGGLNQLRNTAPYSAPFLNQLYRNERDSQDYDRMFNLEAGLAEASKELALVQKDKVVSEIDKIREEIDQIVVNEDFLRSQIKFYDEQVKLIDEQIKTEPYRRAYLSAQRKQCIANAEQARAAAQQSRAAAYNLNVQTQGLQMQNDMLSSGLQHTENGVSGLELYGDRMWNNLYTDLKQLVEIKDKRLWESKVQSMFSDYNKNIAISALEEAYANGTLDRLKSMDEYGQNLIYLSRIFDNCGVFEYHRNVIEGAKYSYSFGPLKYSGTTKFQNPALTDPAYFGFEHKTKK